jgi:hypothetical protein
MRFAFLLVLLGLMLRPSWAQFPPPPPPDWIVVADSRIKALQYEPAAAPVSGAPWHQNQEAVFELSLVPVNGAPTPEEFQWLVARDLLGNGSIAWDTLVVDGMGQEQEAVGRAWYPGVYWVTCEFRLPGSQNIQSRNLQVAVIGGPLQFSLTGSFYRNGNGQDVGVSEVPAHAVSGDTSTPWYLQYFGRDPLLGEYATWEQRPQGVIVGMLPQPEGATITYTVIPSSTVNLLPSYWEVLWLRGTGSTSGEPVKAKVALSFAVSFSRPLITRTTTPS